MRVWGKSQPLMLVETGQKGVGQGWEAGRGDAPPNSSRVART